MKKDWKNCNYPFIGDFTECNPIATKKNEKAFCVLIKDKLQGLMLRVTSKRQGNT